MVLAEGEIEAKHLGINLNLDLNAIREATLSLPEISQRAAQKAEIEAISRILNQTSGNKSKAAQLLGVSYKTLLNKVKEYGIERLE